MSEHKQPATRLLFIAAVVCLAALLVTLWPSLWSEAVGAHRRFAALCLEAAGIVSSRVPLFPLMFAFFPLLVGALAVASAIRQWLATRRVIQSLLEQEVCSIPEPLDRIAASAGLGGRIRLVDAPEFYAFCYGWLRPQVCISTAVVKELPATELEAVLRHESWHVQRRDPLRLLVANALGSALFFLPVARELARHYALEKELWADRATVRAMHDRRPLAAALYRVATGDSAGPSLQATVGAFNAVDARIDQLLGGGVPALRPRSPIAFVSVLVLIGLSLILCVSVMAAQLSAASTCFRC